MVLSVRVVIVAVVAALVAGGAAFALRPERGVPDDAPTLDEMAEEVGAQVMRNIWRGHVAGRSAEIMTVPRPYNYMIGRWPLIRLGTGNPVTASSHPNPWDYLARVPIVFWGPGHVPSGVVSYDVVDVAGLAPTFAEMIGFEGLDAEHDVLHEAHDSETQAPPKVIFTVVIDGGGWNALQQHPDSWPVIRSLIDEGVVYKNATIGSAPSITGAVHATMGTGVYPRTHSIPGNQMRHPDGTPDQVFFQEADLRYLEADTISELYNVEHDNEALVATVSYQDWHLGMIGRGSQGITGKKDIAVIWDVDDNAWWINEEFYTLPDYLQETDLETLESYEEQLDGRDGLVDGTWFGHTLEELQENRIRPGTPAFVTFTGDAVVDVLRNEPWGESEPTDFFWVELKMPDWAGHAWNMVRPEQADVLRETDRQIGRFKRVLDEVVGEGEYVIAITADHGQQPLAETVGSWRINARELEEDIGERFGDIVERATTVDVFMETDRMEELGVSLADVARWLATYTIGDNIPEGEPGADRVPEARLDERLFAGVFPTDYLESLTETDIEGFGDSIYPEGDLTISPET
jgi:hypothetical protein